MTNFKLIYFLVSALHILTAESALSDKRKCADPTCSQKISMARTLLFYTRAEEGTLSFVPNEVATVFSKSAGSNLDLWGVEINGKRGYVPHSMIREYKVFTKDLPHLVDTEINQQVPSDLVIEPNKVDTIESIVVDGTTIYTNEAGINPSNTFSPGLATDVPPNFQEKVKVETNDAITEQPKEVLNEGNVATVQEVKAEEKPVENQNIKQEEVLVANQDVKPVDSQEIKQEIPVVTQEEKPVESQNIKAETQEVKQEEIPVVVQEEKLVEPLKLPEEKPAELQHVQEEKPVELQQVSEEMPVVVQQVSEEKPVVVQQVLEEKPLVVQQVLEEKPVVVQERQPEAVEVKKEEILEKPVDIQHTTQQVVENGEQIQEVKQEDSTIENRPEINSNQIVQEAIPLVSQNFVETLIQENIPSNTETIKVEQNQPQQVAPENSVPFVNVKQEVEVSSTETKLLNENLSGPANVEVPPQESTVDVIGNPILSQFESVQNPMNAIFPNPLGSQKIEKEVEKASQEVLLPKTGNLEESNETINTLDNPSENSPKESVVDENVISSSNKEESGDSEKVSFDYLTGYQMNNVASENVSNESEKSFNIPQTAEDFSSSAYTNPTENSSSNEDLYYEESTESSYINGPEPDGMQENLEVTTSLPNEETVIEEFVEESEGFVSYIMSFFGGGGNVEEEKEEFVERNDDVLLSQSHDHFQCSLDPTQSHCAAQENPNLIPNDSKITETETISEIPFFNFQDLLIVLGISGFSVVVFLWGYMLIDKMKKEAPLIAKINSLEKALLVSSKENQLLSEKMSEDVNREETDSNFNAVVSELEVKLEEVNNSKLLLEEQVASLEKELENSTELGLELNKMLTDVLKSQNGNETLIDNIEQLQKQLLEQQTTINTMNTSLNEKDIENHELQLELEINNKKVVDLQSELDKMALYILEIEEDKEQCQSKFESEIAELKSKSEEALREKEKLSQEVQILKKSLEETRRSLEVKSTEYNLLKETIKDGNVEAVLDSNSLKAELQQMQRDNQNLKESLEQNQDLVANYDKQIKLQLEELTGLRSKYEEADKEKLEALTKLDVLGNYFKEKEAELQNQLSKHESRWVEKQGEAISTSERIKFMQEELQNYKTQNGSLKQEIVSQEVELKSQISVLEKKAHENWVAARQAERKLDDAKQEAAQLRNRLTLRERSMIEDKSQNRLQSPLEMNGDHPLSPHHIDNPSSPPLLFNTRDLTTSPPLPSMPPFLPPPPGVPFMPPPLPGVPPFMPPPPSMFPGDHRPPPLGRRSSPPMNRYSPDSRAYSPYDRNSPSPSDDYYSPPIRGYSPYNGRDDRDMRRDYKKPMPRRNHKGGMSSGSANSNESLDNVKRHHSKV